MDFTRAETAAPRFATSTAALKRIAFRSRGLAIVGLALAGMSAVPARADEYSTRLVRCGAQSCLMVSGYRADPASAVRINGRLVPVEGENGWTARLPLETLREWTPPRARTIKVSLHDTGEPASSVEHVDLPIGVLGDSSRLGSLEVRAPLTMP
ncbi:hypothetical protein [Croceicoccus marinus]|nr:hypothetical protein [Croceicoccus marinus]